MYRQLYPTIAILCGGQSRRMGEDKGLRLFLGKPLIDRVIERLSEIPGFSKKLGICLITNHPDDYAFLNLPMLPDETPGLGPMGGLLTAMTHCTTPLLAAVACDMPFANADLLARMCDVATNNKCDAVVPRSRDGLEPMHAIYRVEACLPAVRAAIATNDLSMMRLLSRLNVREIDSSADTLTFVNVNTPEDWREAARIAHQASPPRFAPPQDGVE